MKRRWSPRGSHSAQNVLRAHGRQPCCGLPAAGRSGQRLAEWWRSGASKIIPCAAAHPTKAAEGVRDGPAAPACLLLTPTRAHPHARLFVPILHAWVAVCMLRPATGAAVCCRWCCRRRSVRSATSTPRRCAAGCGQASQSAMASMQVWYAGAVPSLGDVSRWGSALRNTGIAQQQPAGPAPSLTRPPRPSTQATSPR